MKPTKTVVPWLALAVLAVAALAGGIYLRSGTSREPPATALLGLALPDIEGQEQRLDQWRGKVLVVNFWATWCEPCRKEMPEFVKAQAAMGNRGLQFIGIAIDQPDKVKKFSRDLDLNYPSLIGGYGALELSKSLGNKVMALPFTIIIDREGRVSHTQMGPLRQSKLEAIAEKLL